MRGAEVWRGMMDEGAGAVSPNMLREIVWRIVEVADPDKIILFGSAARGEMGLNSDLDLLIVKAGVPHGGRLTEEIYMGLRGVGIAVDMIIVTPEDVERYRDTHATVIKPAIRDGRGSMSEPPRSPGAPVEWLNRTRTGLLLAQGRSQRGYLEDLAFCVQQAAEKAIVAVLVHLRVEFPYVHDLIALLARVEQAGMAVPDEVAQPGRITPGTAEPVTEEEYRQVLAIAEAVVHRPIVL